MKHGVTRELFDYWTHLRGARAAPERQDIDPAAIRTLLSDTFILEVAGGPASPDYAIRLSGTRINALFLRELKGQPLLSLWEAAQRTTLSSLLGSVVNDCSPVVAGLRAGPPGHRSIDLEMILLPLKHRGRTHARVLGAIAPIESPSWLGLLPVPHFSTSSFRLLGLEPARTCGLGEGPFTRGFPSPKRYGRFLVHQGGR